MHVACFITQALSTVTFLQVNVELQKRVINHCMSVFTHHKWYVLRNCLYDIAPLFICVESAVKCNSTIKLYVSGRLKTQ